MAKEVNKENKEKKVAKTTEKKTVKTEKKENKHFFKEFKAELKRVSWPTMKQLVNNTTAVIAIVLLVSAIVFILDVVFESLNVYGVDKLKALVTSSSSETVVEDQANSEDAATETSNEAGATDSTNTVEDANTTNTTNEATNDTTNSVE